MAFHVPNGIRFREPGHPLATSDADGNYGLFLFTYRNRHGIKAKLRCLASEGLGWEHVSVSLAHRCPTWEEMQVVKEVFWDDDDVVMQLHVPRDQHINNHPYCLHLWRPIHQTIPVPDSILVGIKDE